MTTTGEPEAPPSPPSPTRAGPAAVLFDRDGTLVADVPYNGDPERVRPMPGARAALDALRACGVRVGVVTNQSGVGRGLLTAGQVGAVHRRVEGLLGPFAVWAVCPHRPEADCGCRKPRPGLVRRACRRLGLAPGRVAVVGDIAADMAAADAAGAGAAVLVPTPVTRAEEVAAHRAAGGLLARDLPEAVALLLDGPDRAAVVGAAP